MICKKCGNEIDNNFDNCPKCGYEVRESKKEVDSDLNQRNSKKSSNKRGIIIVTLLAIIIIATIVVAVNVVIPNLTYNTAKSNFEAGNYEKSIEYYNKVINYKDSKELVKRTYFEYGKQLILEKQYEKSLEVLKNVDKDEASDYISYAEALWNIEKGNYDASIKTLTKLENFENSEENLAKANYLKAENLLDNGKYTSAKEYYSTAGEYEDAKEKINICDFLVAEEKYSKGYLPEAKTLYESLPKDLVYKDIKVSDRLETLDKYKDFVDLVGTWKGTDGYYEVRQIYKRNGSWESWYNSYEAEANIRCVINNDGSVKIEGDAPFYSYTNYSTLSSALNYKFVSVPISLTVKAGESIPKKLVSDYPGLIASDGTKGYANIEYSGGKISLNFLLNDTAYSQYFSNKYTSKITFNSKK